MTLLDESKIPQLGNPWPRGQADYIFSGWPRHGVHVDKHLPGSNAFERDPESMSAAGALVCHWPWPLNFLGRWKSNERISLWGSINPLINTLWYIFSMGGPGGSHTARIRKESTICSISLFTFSNDVVLFVYVIYVESVVWIMSDPSMLTWFWVNKSKSELVTFSNRPASSIKTLYLFSEGKFQASGEVVHRHKQVSTWKR